MADKIKIEETGNHPGLYRWMVVLSFLGMIIFACHASTHMVGAGDTWVAMACGRHFANHGVNTVEPFSANSHKAGPTNESMAKYAKELAESIKMAELSGQTGIKTSLTRWWFEKVNNYPNWSEGTKKFAKFMHPTGWINQNWLTHLIFYKLTPKSSYTPSDTFTSNALVYWKFAIYIITVFFVYYAARLLGAHAALAAIFACFAVFTGRSFLDIRPAGFSNLLSAVFLVILILTMYRNILYIWLIVPLIAFWCNVHGGYIYIFIMLIPFVGMNFLGMFFPKRLVSIGKRGLYHTIAAGGVCFLVSIFCNPFRLTNLTHTFVISISEHAKMWRSVNEWHPSFEWNNPVGTSFPFLIIVILGVGLFVFWMVSRLLKPKLLKAPVNKLEDQKRIFMILSKISSCVLAVFICWVTFISFSFIGVDTGSFLLCAIFASILLISIYKSPYLIFLMIPFTLSVMWISGDGYIAVLKHVYAFFGTNYTEPASVGFAGRYIYPLLILPIYVAMHLAVSMFAKKAKVRIENIFFVIITAIASFLLMNFIFNPFNLASFWKISQYFNLYRMWSPAYEGSAKLGYQELFNVLYIINILSVAVWLLVPWLQDVLSKLEQKQQAGQKPQADTYQLPKIDLALVAISALTVYMAIRSRRFIPIAAIIACPVLAMFIDQIIRAVSASMNFYKNKTLTVPSMPYNVQLCITIVGAAAVISFGSWWSLKFKTVYLDPWPTESKLNTVFMRMTASDVKPFYACKFIKDNKMQGNMFNYWTEGGFIAWGQEPDPNTGKTPLQLFMDGRAQAAYEPEDYRKWSEIMFGGMVAQRVRARGQNFTRKDYEEIGDWTDKELKTRKVWVVLMPVKEFENPIVRGLEHNSNWQIVFLDNSQKIMVDITTPQGIKLFNGIFTGETIYPNKFSENLVKSNLQSMSNDFKLVEQSLGYGMEAFKLSPSQIPLQRILNIAKIESLKPKIIKFCEDYLDDFVANKDKYVKQDGYHHKIVAAFITCDFLAAQSKDMAQRDDYFLKSGQFKKEQEALIGSKRW